MADEQTEQTEGARRPLSLLAREKFGDAFKGEVAEPIEEPSKPPAPEESEEAAPEEAEAEEAEAEEAEEAESEEEGQAEEGEETEEEGEFVSSLPELIEAQEWDPEWVNSLKVPVQVDHEQTEVPLGDLINGYRTNKAADKRLEEAKAEKERVRQEMAEKAEALQGQFATAAELVKNAEKLLEQDTGAINWQELRENDPAEYSARKAEFAERREQIEKLKRDAVETYRKSAEQQQETSREQLQEHLRAEQTKLLEKVPEWRDEKVAADEKAQLTRYLVNDLGFDQQDVVNASDHRLVLLGLKAMRHDQGQAKVATAKKKVAKVPKTMKPGTPKPKEQQSQEHIERLQRRLDKSASMEDALALYRAKKAQNA